MISASRSGSRFSLARCFLISRIHSSMLHSRDSAHGTGKLLPLPALQPEDTLSFRRQPVIPPSSLIRFLDPPPLDPTSLFQPVQQRVERGHMKMERASRAHVDELADFVPMPRLALQQGQNQELCAPFFPGLLHFHPHIWASHICYAGSPLRISWDLHFFPGMVRPQVAPCHATQGR